MKFSIRDLFLVTVIVALGLGWWVDRSRLASEITHQGYEHYRLNHELANERDFHARTQSSRDRLLKMLEDTEQQLRESVAKEHPINCLPTSQAPAPNSPKP